MTKTRILLIVLAIAAIAALYALPRVVVENETELASEGVQENAQPSSDPTTETITEGHQHDFSLTEEQEKQVDELRTLLKSSENQEKSIIFADSLAGLYRKYSVFDSSAYYKGLVASILKDEATTLEAADAYLEALNFALHEEDAATLKAKAQTLYQSVLEMNPDQLDAKANLAMTYVGGQDPMKGVMMLREVIQEDPNNKTALFNLGVLSITSNQFDKAIERFERLIELDPKHWEGRLYMGYAYLQSGEKDEAKRQFDMVKKEASEPELQAAADNYLKFIDN